MSFNEPNIVFIMSDDHAAHGISAYGSKINNTPNLDRLADEGLRSDNCFCTNSICAPSRATILTGKHSHLNGVRTLADDFDGRQETFPKILQRQGYQTAIVGKWHLGHGGDHDPTGFDYWNVLPGQGDYENPWMIEMGRDVQYEGYVTNIITDLSLDWLRMRDKNRPFMLLCHHKAPHRNWIPDKKHEELFADVDIPLPETFDDDYENRATAAREAEMRIFGDLFYSDLKLIPPQGQSAFTKIVVPDDLDGFSLIPADTRKPVYFQSHKELKQWMYQRYIKDYLRCVASIDENVGRLLDYLDQEGLTENTIVVYTSDQGFFLGDHGWYDKRFMYEESLRMPFLIRYPREIKAKSTTQRLLSNLDFAPTFLDYAGAPIPSDIQGVSLRSILAGNELATWRDSVYYRYWMHLGEHYVAAHYGIRTERYKLIYYYGDGQGYPGADDEKKSPEWELFDLNVDPGEMNNVFHDPAYARIAKQLKEKLQAAKEEALDFE